MEETDIIQNLTRYGADTAGALERFVGDVELYAECLAAFAADPGFAQLGTALAAGDVRHAFEAAHALKGVAANLGLTPLLAAVTSLVEPLRSYDGQDLSGAYQTLLSELSRFRQVIGAV